MDGCEIRFVLVVRFLDFATIHRSEIDSLQNMYKYYLFSKWRLVPPPETSPAPTNVTLHPNKKKGEKPSSLFFSKKVTYGHDSWTSPPTPPPCPHPPPPHPPRCRAPPGAQRPRRQPGWTSPWPPPRPAPAGSPRRDTSRVACVSARVDGGIDPVEGVFIYKQKKLWDEFALEDKRKKKTNAWCIEANKEVGLSLNQKKQGRLWFRRRKCLVETQPKAVRIKTRPNKIGDTKKCGNSVGLWSVQETPPSRKHKRICCWAAYVAQIRRCILLASCPNPQNRPLMQREVGNQHENPGKWKVGFLETSKPSKGDKIDPDLSPSFLIRQ